MAVQWSHTFWGHFSPLTFFSHKLTLFVKFSSLSPSGSPRRKIIFEQSFYFLMFFFCVLFFLGDQVKISKYSILSHLLRYDIDIYKNLYRYPIYRFRHSHHYYHAIKVFTKGKAVNILAAIWTLFYSLNFYYHNPISVSSLILYKNIIIIKKCTFCLIIGLLFNMHNSKHSTSFCFDSHNFSSN